MPVWSSKNTTHSEPIYHMCEGIPPNSIAECYDNICWCAAHMLSAAPLTSTRLATVLEFLVVCPSR